MINFPTITDTQRIKTITKTGENGGTYPFGTDAMYVDMLSGLDLQEQLLFGNGINATDVTVVRDNDKTTVTEIFSIEEEDNLTKLYKKETIIYKQKRQRSYLIADTAASTFLAADYGPDTSPDTEDDTLLIYDFIDSSGFGNVITTLYRYNGLSELWEPIHKKKTEVTINILGQITAINEYFIDLGTNDEDASDTIPPDQLDPGLQGSNVVGEARIGYAKLTTYIEDGQ